MKSNFYIKERIIIFTIFLVVCIFVTKLFLLQIVHSETYSSKADRQYSTPSSSLFERGTIYFQRKDGELVSASTQSSGFKLAINPTKIDNAELIYNKLSEIIYIDREKFIERASKKDDPYEEVVNRLSKEEADAISALKIEGLSIFREKWRFYPGGDLASHILGFVGYKGEELGGRYGLERQYEDVLKRGGSTPYVNFFAEVFSNINDSFFNKENKKGDIVTTIEPTVQGFLEKTLGEVKEKYDAKSVGGIIMNPKDGSIYALSALPSFDPNNFSDASSNSIFSNPLVENVLEFGSVVKPLVMSAGLDTGVITAYTKYNDTGSVIVEKKEIFNFDKKGRGVVTMQDVLGQSLNTGMVFVERQLGKENMRDYLFSFGIKEKTGIDLPNETNGLVSNLNSPREIEYANASFGQGIAIAPINLIRALSSLGNGGKLVVPHVVDRIKYENGTEEKFVYPTTDTKITKETSEEITRMLVGVMDEFLQSGKGKIDRYSVAVKTGTAQVADTVNGGYYKDKHTHSFFGYFPAYDPKFIILFYVTEPKGVQYASVTWANPFIEMTKFLINYYEIPPDR